MAAGRSIRSKIIVLLALPLASLVVLWGYAASHTTHDAANLLRVDTIWRGVVDHADLLVARVQQERLAAAERLAGADDPVKVGRTRAAVDEASKALTDSATSDDTQSALNAEMKRQLQAVFAAAARLPEIRRQVDRGALTPSRLVEEYATVSDAVWRLYAEFALATDLELYRRANGLIAADQVRELLSREHALVVAAAGKPDLQLLSRIDGARTWQFRRAMTDLDEELRAPYEKVPLAPVDRAVATLTSGGELTVAQWRAAMDPALAVYTEAMSVSGEALLARAEPAGTGIVARAAVAGLVGLVAVILSVVVAVRMGRGLARELAGLRAAAQDLAEVRLPHLVERLKRGERPDIPREAIPSGTTTEIADVATAFGSVRDTAVEAAVGQAVLREGVAEALRNLARRSQSLVQRQLSLLQEMQGQTEDPEALGKLFKLDHLTTRMRRHAEGLVLLTGGKTGRAWRGAIPVEEVVTGAAAQVEDYTRVRVYPMPECGVSGLAVADLMHLFAELIENAAAFSAPTNEVSVRGEVVGKGFAVEIEDRGFGMDAEQLRAVNARLAAPPDFNPADTERLGFAVVALLASRHGVQVTLKASPYGGTTAVVLLPADLLEQPEPAPAAAPGRVPQPRQGQARGPGLPRRVRKVNRSPEEVRALLQSDGEGTP
ncbi:nitrate- and nitrite sensing domain-containing protein [Thermoactinospora rubra]|uniref:sensor histidine kinase n=1 Tax=Thermoactinospora rubra TaxID=1088767 RepID=UPI000A0FC79D|nr:nitrate- and nitrite sensing domain-containing protein [Thermoactinospora rubra]